MLMRFIQAGGVDTRCLVAGREDAPPLLLLHGLTLTADVWMRNLDALGEHFRVVAIDLLGHGFTRPRDGQPLGIAEKLDHLAAVADCLGFERFALDGSSYGALIAANFLLRHPERVSRLVITGSGSCFNSEAQLADFVARIYALHKDTLTVSSPEEWCERLRATFHDPAAIPRELGVILALCYAQPWMAGAWLSTIGAMMEPAQFRPFRILERLEAIEAETLVVWGRQDRGGVLENAVAAVARMPRAKLVAFDDCGHVPMLEHPELYNRTVRDFLMAG